MTIPPGGSPLTEAQEGLHYARRLDPANPIFNTGQYLDLAGPLDIAAFTAAVNAVGVEAEALALRIEEGPSGPVQHIDPALRPQLTIVDLSSEADPEGVARAAIARDMATAVDPAAGPLAAQTLYRLGPERHFWAQRVHHLATDGYGMVLLTARVAELYARNVGGSTVPDRPFTPLAAVWQEDADYRDSDARRDDAAWWRQAMAGLGEVAGMAPGRPVSGYSFHRHEAPLPAETRKALLDRAKRLGVGWPDVLSALVAAYCRRFSGGEEIVVGLPQMGRMGSVSARVPATVMNVLPLRVAIDEAELTDALIARVASDSREARRHGRYRSEQLRRDLGLIGGHRRLYGPLVNVQPYDRPPRFHGLDVRLHVTGTGPVDDLNVTFRGDGASSLTLEVDANPDLHPAEAVATHGIRLPTFLAAALVADRLAEVPTATPAEAQAELAAAEGPAHDLGSLAEASLAELIERQCTATPTAEAVRFEGRWIDFATLDRRTQALAAVLRARGAAPGRIVAVALPRSIELVVALVAVLRAGAAYLPIDPDQPPARIDAILADADPVAVLTQAHHGGERRLPPADWPRNPPENPFLPLPLPDHPAYVIYTSGSTGSPKGVVVGHRAIVNRLLWMQDRYAITAADRILQKTPATFDVSVWEFFLPLISGATLVVASPGAHRDPRALAALIRSEQVTALHFVPSMLGLFLDAPESTGLRVRLTFCSGEALPAALRDRFHQRVTGELHNLYGPTEAAVDVSHWAATAEDRSDPVPIGHPVWNTRLLLLDEQMHPVPQGMAGHLHLGGIQLAQGYLGRGDLTAERFVPDPFRPGERLYRSGDLAWRRPDGAIVYLGRADEQVKIRGIRVEPGEVEAAIAASGLVRAAAVIARDGRLIAYVVPTAPDAVSQLRPTLAATLPDHLVPAAIVALEALPTTANGKLDRKALPAPVFEGGNVPPATEAEAVLACLIADLLEVAHVGRHDDFFALGGDSLAAVQLLARVREHFGHDPGLGALFEHPEVATFATLIEAGEADAAAALGPLVRLATGPETRAPLFLIHPAGGLCWGYRTLARSLDPARRVFGLQSPALDPDMPLPASIDALGVDYAKRVAAMQPAGPCHIAGWSVGGIIAQAVAVALSDMGREVGLVALLDSYPADCWRAEPEPTEQQALGALLVIAGFDPASHSGLLTRGTVMNMLRDGGGVFGTLPPAALDGVVRAVLDTNRLVRGHRHRRYAGTLTHIRAALDHRNKPQLLPGLWKAYAGAVDMIDLPFLHGQLTGAAASAAMAPALSARMIEIGKEPG